MIATDTIKTNLRPASVAEVGLVDAIIGASRECILLIDRNTRIVAANAAAQTTFGREVADKYSSAVGETE